MITILGDASEPGIYAQLLKVAAGAEIPAHHHAVDRIGTVLQAATLRNDHEPVTVLLTGVGPTDTVYENPADDPTKKH